MENQQTPLAYEALSLWRRIPRYARLVRAYWSESRTLHDFMKLLRVRLARSKVGRWVCGRPRLFAINGSSLGEHVLLRSHTTDISVLAEVAVARCYEATSQCMDTAPRTIVSLGANTGLAARWFLNRYPEARIVAVEPERENLSVLRRNLERFAERATVVAACVGARRRSVHLRTASGAWGYSMSDREAEEGPLAQVVTMEDVLAAGGMDAVDLLKCDIEGAERELFESCGAWIGRVRTAVVECHGGLSGPELLEMIRRQKGRMRIAHRSVDERYGHEVVVLTRVG